MDIFLCEPRVFLIGMQEIQQDEMTRFLQHHGMNWESDSENPSEILSETAGRVCYMSFEKPRPGGNKAYLERILSSGHGSVLEHGVWNFIITGISRSLTHELVRHRVGTAFSQLSQRYVDESVAEYVEPDIIKADQELHQTWMDVIDRVHDAYKTLSTLLSAKLNDPNGSPHLQKFLNGLPTDATMKRKVARQAARSVLPNATETKMFLTMNTRAIRHFVEQRGSIHAEPEIRKLAHQIWILCYRHAPNLFGDYKLRVLPDDTVEISTEFKKV